MVKVDSSCDFCGGDLAFNDSCMIGKGEFDRMLYGFVSEKLRTELRGGETPGLIERAADELLNGPNRKLVNMISAEYCLQFPDFYKPQGAGGDSSGLTQDLEELFDGGKSGDRIRWVLRKTNPKDLFLLGHNYCFGEFVQYEPYYITLDRIDNHTKALAWTDHLGNKTNFNFQGWRRTLNKLFGHIPLP